MFLLVLDAAVLGFSILLAFAVRFDPASLVDQFRIFSVGVWVLVGVQLLALLAGGLYRSVLRHASSELLGLLLRSVLLGAGLFALLGFLLKQLLNDFWEMFVFQLMNFFCETFWRIFF